MLMLIGKSIANLHKFQESNFSTSKSILVLKVIFIITIMLLLAMCLIGGMNIEKPLLNFF